MTEDTDGKLCVKKESIVTAEQAIAMINNTDRFKDDETRTYFWLFAEGLDEPDGKILDHPDFKKVLGVVQRIRPNAHSLILKNITEELLAAKSTDSST